MRKRRVEVHLVVSVIGNDAYNNQSTSPSTPLFLEECKLRTERMLELVGTNVPNHSHPVVVAVVPKDREPAVVVSGG
jgi:hypothetical protein